MTQTAKIPGAIIIEGHVQGLSNVRSLGEKGIPCIVVDKSNCIARYSKYCNAFFRCPEFNSDEFVKFLVQLCEKENLHDWVLIPSNDHAVRSIAASKNLLEQYYKIVTDDISKIEKIYNKKNLLSIAEAIGVPFPATYYPQSTNLLDFDLKFPVLVKGIEGLTFVRTMHRKAFVCRNAEDLKTTLMKVEEKLALNKVFIQEIIERANNSFVCSCTAFAEKGTLKAFWIGDKVREHPIRFGTATYSVSIPANGTLDHTKKLLKEIGYTGVCEVEFIKDVTDNRYKLIEINARTWLWVGLAKAAGIDYALYLYNYANGIPQEYPKNYKTGIAWKNSFTDIIFSTIAIFKGQLRLSGYLTSYKNKHVNAVFSSKDPIPGLMFAILIFYLFVKRT